MQNDTPNSQTQSQKSPTPLPPVNIPSISPTPPQANPLTTPSQPVKPPDTTSANTLNNPPPVSPYSSPQTNRPLPPADTPHSPIPNIPPQYQPSPPAYRSIPLTPTSTTPAKKHIPSSLLLLAPVIIVTFVLSMLYYSGAFKTSNSSRASAPTPPVSQLKATLFPRSTPNTTPASTSKSQGSSFGSILNNNASPSTPVSTTPVPSASPPPMNDYSSVSFEITAENDLFIPDQITVDRNQIVKIILYAKDKQYDLEIPGLSLKRTVLQGEKKSLEFQAQTEGEVPFYCTGCANPESPKGKIVIK